MRIRVKTFGVSGFYYEVQRKWLCFWVSIPSFDTHRFEWSSYTFGAKSAMLELGEKLKGDEAFAAFQAEQIRLSCVYTEETAARKAMRKQPDFIKEL